jgi:hypothetical protein
MPLGSRLSLFCFPITTFEDQVPDEPTSGHIRSTVSGVSRLGWKVCGLVLIVRSFSRFSLEPLPSEKGTPSKVLKTNASSHVRISGHDCLIVF